MGSAIALCVVLLVSGSAEAICMPRDPPVVNSPKDYASAFVDALIVLRSAIDSSREIGKAATPTDAMVAFTRTDEAYECAYSYLKAYQGSSNEAIQTSAMSFGLAMVQLTRATDGFREEFKDALDQKPEKPSEHAERSARLTVMGNDAWKYEMNATVSTGLALIDFDAAKKQRLALTSSERDALVKKLEKTFGVLAHAKGELPGLENSVSVLLDFLTDKDRKTSDAN